MFKNYYSIVDLLKKIVLIVIELIIFPMHVSFNIVIYVKITNQIAFNYKYLNTDESNCSL